MFKVNLVQVGGKAMFAPTCKPCRQMQEHYDRYDVMKGSEPTSPETVIVNDVTHYLDGDHSYCTEIDINDNPDMTEEM